MFKQVFVFILVFLTIFILSYFTIKFVLIRTHKVYTDNSKVKYPLQNYSDKQFLEWYTKEIPIYELKTIKENVVFYTTKKWSTQNNNYIKFKEKYFIIEPGYYYHVFPETELFLNNNCKIKIKVNDKR